MRRVSLDNPRQTEVAAKVAKSVDVPAQCRRFRTNVTADSTEVIIDLEDSVQYSSGGSSIRTESILICMRRG